MTNNCYYPVFLDLKGRDCVVVGGGRVAGRKVSGLLKAGASVRVISPRLSVNLQKEKTKGRIRHISRPYRKSDLKGAFLVIAATDSYEENKKVSSDAGNAPVNVVDTPSLCSFIVPSTVQRGPLVIAVSTSGKSPAMAKTIRMELETLYPDVFGTYLGSLGKLRAGAVSGIKDKKIRERLLKSLASPAVTKKLRALAKKAKA